MWGGYAYPHFLSFLSLSQTQTLSDLLRLQPGLAGGLDELLYLLLFRFARFTRRLKYYLYLTAEERRYIFNALLAYRNNLIAQGRYTDAVDEVMIKFAK